MFRALLMRIQAKPSMKIQVSKQFHSIKPRVIRPMPFNLVSSLFQECSSPSLQVQTVNHLSLLGFVLYQDYTHHDMFGLLCIDLYLGQLCCGLWYMWACIIVLMKMSSLAQLLVRVISLLSTLLVTRLWPLIMNSPFELLNALKCSSCMFFL